MLKQTHTNDSGRSVSDKRDKVVNGIRIAGIIGAEQLSRLEFIVRMLGEMRLMAQGLDDRTLSYLIEMACLHGEEELTRLGMRKS